ncbi:hypothetical protein PCE1_003460 [Barthelona sp. PCE]
MHFSVWVLLLLSFTGFLEANECPSETINVFDGFSTTFSDLSECTFLFEVKSNGPRSTIYMNNVTDSTYSIIGDASQVLLNFSNCTLENPQLDPVEHVLILKNSQLATLSNELNNITLIDSELNSMDRTRVTISHLHISNSSIGFSTITVYNVRVLGNTTFTKIHFDSFTVRFSATGSNTLLFDNCELINVNLNFIDIDTIRFNRCIQNSVHFSSVLDVNHMEFFSTKIINSDYNNDVASLARIKNVLYSDMNTTFKKGYMFFGAERNQVINCIYTQSSVILQVSPHAEALKIYFVNSDLPNISFVSGLHANIGILTFSNCSFSKIEFILIAASRFTIENFRTPRDTTRIPVKIASVLQLTIRDSTLYDAYFDFAAGGVYSTVDCMFFHNMTYDGATIVGGILLPIMNTLNITSSTFINIGVSDPRFLSNILGADLFIVHNSEFLNTVFPFSNSNYMSFINSKFENVVFYDQLNIIIIENSVFKSVSSNDANILFNYFLSTTIIDSTFSNIVIPILFQGKITEFAYLPVSISNISIVDVKISALFMLADQFLIEVINTDLTISGVQSFFSCSDIVDDQNIRINVTFSNLHFHSSFFIIAPYSTVYLHMQDSNITSNEYLLGLNILYNGNISCSRTQVNGFSNKSFFAVTRTATITQSDCDGIVVSTKQQESSLSISEPHFQVVGEKGEESRVKIIVSDSTIAKSIRFVALVNSNVYNGTILSENTFIFSRLTPGSEYRFVLITADMYIAKSGNMIEPYCRPGLFYSVAEERCVNCRRKSSTFSPFDNRTSCEPLASISKEITQAEHVYIVQQQYFVVEFQHGEENSTSVIQFLCSKPFCKTSSWVGMTGRSMSDISEEELWFYDYNNIELDVEVFSGCVKMHTGLACSRCVHDMNGKPVIVEIFSDSCMVRCPMNLLIIAIFLQLSIYYIMMKLYENGHKVRWTAIFRVKDEALLDYDVWDYIRVFKDLVLLTIPTIFTFASDFDTEGNSPLSIVLVLAFNPFMTTAHLLNINPSAAMNYVMFYKCVTVCFICIFPIVLYKIGIIRGVGAKERSYVNCSSLSYLFLPYCVQDILESFWIFDMYENGQYYTIIDLQNPISMIAHFFLVLVQVICIIVVIIFTTKSAKCRIGFKNHYSLTLLWLCLLRGVTSFCSSALGLSLLTSIVFLIMIFIFLTFFDPFAQHFLNRISMKYIASMLLLCVCVYLLSLLKTAIHFYYVALIPLITIILLVYGTVGSRRDSKHKTDEISLNLLQ